MSAPERRQNRGYDASFFYHAHDFTEGRKIFKGISVNRHHVSSFSFFQAARFFFDATNSRAMDRDGLERLQARCAKFLGKFNFFDQLSMESIRSERKRN